MAKVAKKKKVDNSLAYEFCILQKDVEERVSFGSFEVVKTKKGMLFKTYTGYHVFCTPYTVDMYGETAKTSLYQWLENLLDTYHAFEGRLDEPFGEGEVDGQPILNKDIMDMDKIVTEANLVYPLTVFTDTEHAVKAANEQIAWLREQSEKLAESMAKDLSTDDDVLRAEAHEAAKVDVAETLKEIQEEMKDGTK